MGPYAESLLVHLKCMWSDLSAYRPRNWRL